MILAEARDRIGRQVIYHPPSGGDEKHGVITSVADVFVYVRYDDDDHAKGTAPAQLTPAA